MAECKAACGAKPSTDPQDVDRQKIIGLEVQLEECRKMQGVFAEKKDSAPRPRGLGA
jgi:hypothetical protein